jgi:hypothetical protein
VFTATADRLMGEGLLSPSALAKQLPSFRVANSGSTHPATIKRWIERGILLPDGTRLRLEAVKVGARWMSSVPALKRFIDRQTEQRANPTTPAEPRLIPADRLLAAAQSCPDPLVADWLARLAAEPDSPANPHATDSAAAT